MPITLCRQRAARLVMPATRCRHYFRFAFIDLISPAYAYAALMSLAFRARCRYRATLIACSRHTLRCSPQVCRHDVYGAMTRAACSIGCAASSARRWREAVASMRAACVFASRARRYRAPAAKNTPSCAYSSFFTFAASVHLFLRHFHMPSIVLLPPCHIICLPFLLLPL